MGQIPDSEKYGPSRLTEERRHAPERPTPTPAPAPPSARTPRSAPAQAAVSPRRNEGSPVLWIFGAAALLFFLVWSQKPPVPSDSYIQPAPSVEQPVASPPPSEAPAVVDPLPIPVPEPAEPVSTAPDPLPEVALEVPQRSPDESVPRPTQRLEPETFPVQPPQIEAARKLSGQPPSYPEIARRMRWEGDVRLTATVGPDGRISDITVITSARGLDDSAIQALSRWRYRPATRDGAPISSQIEVTFNFRLPR
jgi:periplasmic protein TonB